MSTHCSDDLWTTHIWCNWHLLYLWYSLTELALAQSLNLERLVLSTLNPLRLCAAPIVSNFAAVTRRFQLAYCYTIMENNKRLQIPSSCINEKTLGNASLDMFFPFDPYLLVRYVYIKKMERVSVTFWNISWNGTDITKK